MLPISPSDSGAIIASEYKTIELNPKTINLLLLQKKVFINPLNLDFDAGKGNGILHVFYTSILYSNCI